jgi:hypothetical protein
MMQSFSCAWKCGAHVSNKSITRESRHCHCCELHITHQVLQIILAEKRLLKANRGNRRNACINC